MVNAPGSPCTGLHDSGGGGGEQLHIAELSSAWLFPPAPPHCPEDLPAGPVRVCLGGGLPVYGIACLLKPVSGLLAVPARPAGGAAAESSGHRQ